MRRFSVLLILLFLSTPLLTAGGGQEQASSDGVLTVFAAASLTDAVSDFAELYEKASGVTVQVSFASSSVLARQIAAGAGADVYFTANSKWADFLEQEGFIGAGKGSRRVLCTNSLVVIGTDSSEGFIADPAVVLADTELLALGDPDHVPAGVYAAAALENLGLMETLKPVILPCPDVRAALRAVESGDADRGIVYATDARSSRVDMLSVIPADSHPEISYEVLGLDTGENDDVEAFLNLVLGPEGCGILEEYGFLPVGVMP